MDIQNTHLREEVVLVSPLLAKAVSWFDRPGASESALIYHADPDGVVSAGFINAFIEKRFGTKSRKRSWIGTHEFDFERLRAWIHQVNPRFIALFDVNIIERTDILEEWERTGIEVLIYDDHEVSPLRIPKNITYLSPLSLEIKRPIPPCLFAALIEGSLEPQHITALSIGLIGEHLFKEYSDVLTLAPLSRPKLDEITRLIVAFYLASDHSLADASFTLITQILATRPKNLVDVNTTPAVCALRQYRHIVDRDVAKNTHDVSQWIHPTEQYYLLLREVDAESRVAGLIASSMRDSKDSAVAVAYQDIGDRIVVEARRSRNLTSLQLVDLLRKLARGVSVLNLGGHPAAAGMAFPQKDRSKFIANLQNWVGEWSNDKES